MKKTEVHVLNGDALRKQLPQSVEGKRIVFREAFIEGPLSEELNDTFYAKRSDYMAENYAIEKAEYYERSKAELDKIRQVKRDAHVNLWFEHDAFCQANLWYCCRILVERKFTGKAFLVLPNAQTETWLGFASHGEDDLWQAYQNRILLAPFEMKQLANCWTPYSLSYFRRLIRQVNKIAHLLPYSEEVARAIAELKMKNLTHEFVAETIQHKPDTTFDNIFKAFTKEYGILGLGDLQLKLAYDEFLR